MSDPSGSPPAPEAAPDPAPELDPSTEPVLGAADRNFPFWSYQDLVVLLGLALPMLIVSALLVRGVAALIPPGRAVPAASVLSAQFLAYALWFLCLWALIRIRYDKPFWPSLGWVNPRHSLARYFFYGPLLALAVGIAGSLLQTPETPMPMMDMLQDRLSLIIVGAFAVTLGPLCEELAFRGFILPLLARSIGPAAGILITSAVFATLHGPQYAWSWRHILLITIAGAIFCLVRLRSGSTLAAAAMHATYNLTFFIAFLAQENDLPI